MSNKRLKRNQRIILERIIITGTLILDTPTCLGNGDADGSTDLMLLRDSISSKALLTGTSIAGALRNYLHEYQYGYGQDEKHQNDNLSTYLFGGSRKDKDGEQSPLIIHDSISNEIPRVELRDGVRIDIATGTAKNQAKYDLELLAAGTEFPLYFELLIEEGKNKNQLLEALVIALQGLEKSEINIGMKKRRGFGRCHIEKWQIWQFDLNDYKHRLAWLTFDRDDWKEKYTQDILAIEGKIVDIFQEKIRSDQRHRFHLKATFNLIGSLLIRSGQFSTETVPDVVHIKSHRNGKVASILPGTSFTGVLRHRAEKIVKTLGISTTFIYDIFGIFEENIQDAQSSRLVVNETVIEQAIPLVQNRIAIDRFTGGALHGALFDEQPIFGGKETIVTLDLELRQPNNAEIGLLLLLLKDLWTSDLPIGGESSIGRGRLQGIKAEMRRFTPDNGEDYWQIIKEEDKLQISDVNNLEKFVGDLNKIVNQVVA
ncbi:putative RAMP superfamily protein probably involved in DNA repair [Cylindrospermum stagnale PCC 7417]|uniref:Putative RAMP superfamily protein probably involved in DNA repair n=1 Tax=Cylindrospermum stagnale PCC 7417 TaxID=56107 RepID=K9X6M5_9NOST|nr:RAMP superfamily CRISPR-associated protein [Cylindrospermum stagnale]AFZ28133.1 putative RAMP superfamily protein probably involved in DNA repair [Cylindrospermum stagnale PCC 7417]